MNNSHESFLVPFFKEMNTLFPNSWCVLHSYETLPHYSASDVDMAFSGTDTSALELLIKKVADSTGWILLQKLWYDVQNCYYYVLCHKESDTLLAIDFLIDNDAIGKYAFTTKVLTSVTIMEKDSFPIPNSEVAFCYKLIKRIVKKRSVTEDEKYLRDTYLRADKEKVDKILTHQLGIKGKELILRYLTDKNTPLTKSDITLLHTNRKNTLHSFNKGLKYRYWELKRSINRVVRPSGMILYTVPLEEIELTELTNLLAKKVDILFRFVKIGLPGNALNNLKGFAGSTLLICPSKDAKLKSSWVKTHMIMTSSLEKSDKKYIQRLADLYYDQIVTALEDRMSKRMPHGY